LNNAAGAGLGLPIDALAAKGFPETGVARGEGLPSMERIIASAIRAGDAAVPWVRDLGGSPGFESIDVIDKGISGVAGVLNIMLMRPANAGIEGVVLATGNVNAASRLA